MKKFVSFLIALMMPLFIFGQSYNSLWKKVSEAQEKDLPKTAYDVLQKIVKKAAKDKAYGQLLKAELLSAQAMVEISPDSLEPAVAEIRKHYEAASDEVLKTVYQTVLHRIDVMNYSISIDIKAPRLTPALCETLGSVKDETYKPFVVGGVDAAIFNNDMLSVIGYEIDSDFEEMHAYYEKVGRPANWLSSATISSHTTQRPSDWLISVRHCRSGAVGRGWTISAMRSSGSPIPSIQWLTANRWSCRSSRSR